IDIPVVFWQKEHLAYLEEIIRHGLNDVGLSKETLFAIIKLLLRLLPSHFAWGAQHMQIVMRERGFIEINSQSKVYSPTSRIPQLKIEPERLKELFSLLLPILQSWIQQAKEVEALSAIEYFASRDPLPEGITDLLSTLLQQTQTPATAERALRLLARHEPRLL